jgi:hypothetical protein
VRIDELFLQRRDADGDRVGGRLGGASPVTSSGSGCVVAAGASVPSGAVVPSASASVPAGAAVFDDVSSSLPQAAATSESAITPATRRRRLTDRVAVRDVRAMCMKSPQDVGSDRWWSEVPIGPTVVGPLSSCATPERRRCG